MFKLDEEKCYDSSCLLGEGLFVGGGDAYWVDIDKNKIWRSCSEGIHQGPAESKPSVIFSASKDGVVAGAAAGLLSFSFVTGSQSVQPWLDMRHSALDYRSNDGGCSEVLNLIGFMSNSDPVNHSGFIYIFDGNRLTLIDDTIHIPNTFVFLESRKVLISDSLKGEIWLFVFDDSNELVEKRLWASTSDNISPDGGCKIGQYVLIACWGASSIAVFDLRGSFMQRLQVPVLKPTNCKFDKSSGRLWVTSAREGMSKAELDKYPLSGNTLSYSLAGEW